MVDTYKPSAWFWIVGGDASRAWSSAASAYVTEWDANCTTRIASEADLRDVLRPYGIRGPGVTLNEIKAEYSAKLDHDAEAVRQKFVTPGAGMAMTYQEKHAQARAVDALGQTAANALTEAEREDQFPTLSASVGIEGATLWDCAQLVITKYEQFADLSRVIERTRLQGKKAISDASDVASVYAAYEGITWTV